jgi:radical SAM superfamily enzyme YgiQ (UPF0313 family)
MVDIILVNTCQEDFKQGIYNLGNSRKNQPLDLALIAAVLEEQQLKVKIIDANLLQISHRRIAQEIKADKPKMVVINTAAIDRWECPLPIVKQPQLLSVAIKNAYPKARLAAIGPHGTITPDWVLENCPNINILVRGEPEMTIKDIVANIPLKNIPGISYRLKGKITHNPDRPYSEDLNTLPIPAYHLLPMKLYGPLSDHFNGENLKGATHPFSILLTSRGCPGQCTFCLRKMYQQRKTYRARSPEKVIEEIELLTQKFKVKAIYIQDLSFCIDNQRVIGICKLMMAKKIRISWGCEARFDNITLPLARVMKKAGCTFINFGLESGSEKVIELCRKNIPVPVTEKAIADCQKTGIAVGVFKLLGLPGETRQTFIETLKFMVRNKLPIPYPFPANLPIPYPGTELHRQAEEQYKTKISWEEAPIYAGRVGTDFFDRVSLPEIQRLTYQYKLKQLGKPIDKHYLKLLSMEKFGKFFAQ